MWVTVSCSTEELGGVGDEIYEGGPRKWEAQPVRPKNEPRFSSWFVFSHPFLNPLLTMQNNRPDEEVIPTSSFS